jgi:Domain of unknown function (DUF2760)
MEPWLIVVITVVAVVVVEFLLIVALGGGNFDRIGLAFSAFLRLLRDQPLADKVRPLLEPPEVKGPPKPSGEPLRLLALLQRGDGRFLDFVMENVEVCDDSQITAAVRTMQPVWQRTLKEHLVLEPVRAEPEGTDIEVPAGFDPSAILLTGNVTGTPPYRGTLKHAGWRVKEMKLPPVPEGQDQFVIMPAEVELP